MGGIAYAVSDSGGTMFGGVPAPASSSTVSLIETATSSSRFFVAIRAPGDIRDHKYMVDLGTKEVKSIEVPKGWRVEGLNDVQDISKGLRIESSADRGFKLTDGYVGDWNVILRSPSGEAYTEPRLLGKLDDKHAIVAARTDHMQILDVSRVGQVIVLADVPENTNIFGLSGGAVWMATLTPGEGLESEPTGPSTLYKVTQNGGKEVVGSIKTTDYYVGVLSEGLRKTVWLNTGSFTADGDGSGFQGVGHPLARLDEDLLVAEGKRLFLYDAWGQKQDVGVTLDGEPAAARALE
jgi:hypothetical protein